MKWFALVATVCALLLAMSPPAAASSRQILVLSLDGAVQPASLRYIERGIEAAAERDAELVIVELDTPGGTLVSLRLMTRAITQSEAPVAVFVTPSGARAASAGFFLLLAADVAAMSPGTNTGAAHPVGLGRGSGEGDDVALTKAAEDAAALARSLAAARGRPIQWAEKAVVESRSYSTDEALGHGLIEITAKDRRDLVTQLDGIAVRRFDGRSQTLELSGANVTELEPTFAEQILMVIADPQVAYLLMMLGMLGLLVELTSPGAFVPGIAGAISLLLALYAFSVLPVNWVGFLLIAAGLALLVAEAFVTSYGLLALAGLASFVFGSLILVDTPIPDWRIGLELIIPAAVVIGAVSALLLSRAWRATRAPIRSGIEALIGEVGELTSAIDESQGEGKIFVHGEYWDATAEKALPRGARVRVERVEGRRLRVAPAGPASP